MTQEIRLTDAERNVLEDFHKRCVVNGVTQFSSDTFRSWGFDTYLYGDTQHSVGALFYKALKLKKIRKIGHVASAIESNHHREIKLYEWIT